MIDNVVNIIEGLKNKVDIDSLLANADPLGYFKEMRSIKVMDDNDYTALYRDVLIDTPVGPYFMRFLEDSLTGSESMTMQDIMNIFKEMKPEFIRTSLKKMWLEDFKHFCNK
jgi:V-type H+-transporting ATPase subunit d